MARLLHIFTSVTIYKVIKLVKQIKSVINQQTYQTLVQHFYTKTKSTSGLWVDFSPLGVSIGHSGATFFAVVIQCKVIPFPNEKQ